MSLPAQRVTPQPTASDPVFDAWRRDGLVWLPEKGMGFYPVDPEDEPYDEDYFRKYQEYAATPRGRAITSARVDLVAAHHAGELVDVGIGCGDFIQARGPETYGCDVNPVGVRWLHERGLYRDPYHGSVEAVSLWDVLEHLPFPAALLANVRTWVFTCLPVFRDDRHLLASKHFRKDEHRWYWTREGLLEWFGAHGFRCVEESDSETQLGREDIRTFAFRRCG